METSHQSCLSISPLAVKGFVNHMGAAVEIPLLKTIYVRQEAVHDPPWKVSAGGMDWVG